MTARETFDERWDNEQQYNPQPPDRKEREYMIYLCGWEDGIRAHMVYQSTNPVEVVHIDRSIRTCMDCGGKGSTGIRAGYCPTCEGKGVV